MDPEDISSSGSEFDNDEFEVGVQDALRVPPVQFNSNKFYESPTDDSSDDDENIENLCQAHILNLRARIADTYSKKSTAPHKPQAYIISNVLPASTNISQTSSNLLNDINSLNHELGLLVLSQFIQHVYRQSAAVLNYCAKSKSKHDSLQSNADSRTISPSNERKKEFLIELDEAVQKQKRMTEKKINEITFKMSTKSHRQSELNPKAKDPPEQLQEQSVCEALVNIENEVAQDIAVLSKFLHESAATTKEAYDSEATVADDLEFTEELDTDEPLARAVYARACTDICQQQLELAAAFHGYLKLKPYGIPNTQDTCSRCVPFNNMEQRNAYFINSDRLDWVLPNQLPPTSLKCGCPQTPPCLLCTGRKNPTLPRSVAMKKKNMTLLDLGYHPVLSPCNVENSDIALEGFAANSQWQQNFKRMSARNTLRKLIKKTQATNNSGPPRVKRKYVKKKHKKDGVTVESTDTSVVVKDAEPMANNANDDAQSAHIDECRDDLVMDVNLNDWDRDMNTEETERYYDPQELEIGAYEDILAEGQADEEEDGEIDVVGL